MEPWRDDYEVQRELGRGGMGVVYLARQKSLDRLVALKVLNMDQDDLARVARRFEQEARSLEALHHENVIQLFDVRFNGAHSYIAMEFLPDARPLDAIFQDRGPLDLDRAFRLCRAATAGVAHMHQKRVIHRDIKPANILIAGDHTLKFVDFGLAKSLSTDRTLLTQDGQVLGTLSYMAPEQLLAGTVDERSDVYALGEVMLELIAGRALFSSASGQLVTPLERIKKGVPGVDKLCARADPRIGRLIARCLEREPRDRPRTGVDVDRALREILDRPGAAGGKTISATPDLSSATPATFALPRRSAVFALAAVLVAIPALFLLRGRPAATVGPQATPSPAREPAAVESELSFTAWHTRAEQALRLVQDLRRQLETQLSRSAPRRTAPVQSVGDVLADRRPFTELMAAAPWIRACQESASAEDRLRLLSALAGLQPYDSLCPARWQANRGELHSLFCERYRADRQGEESAANSLFLRARAAATSRPGPAFKLRDLPFGSEWLEGAGVLALEMQTAGPPLPLDGDEDPSLDAIDGKAAVPSTPGSAGEIAVDVPATMAAPGRTVILRIGDGCYGDPVYLQLEFNHRLKMVAAHSCANNSVLSGATGRIYRSIPVEALNPGRNVIAVSALHPRGLKASKLWFGSLWIYSIDTARLR